MELKERELGRERTTDLAYILTGLVAKAQAVAVALEADESTWSGPEMIELHKMFQHDAAEALAVLDISQDEYKAISAEIMTEMMSDGGE